MMARVAPAALAALLALRAGAPAAQSPRDDSRGAAAVSRAEVRAMADRLRADPDLKPTERVHQLRWDSARKPEPDPRRGNSALERFFLWLFRATAWFAEAARWAIWVLGAVVVALVAVLLRRWMRERADPGAAIRIDAPAHVGALDVRPQSLPEHVGAEARALWGRGERRAALSLLYRGALSRLIHTYRVPIRAAHTEGECLRLARGRLDAQQGEYFARLVGVWQLAVYGAREPGDDGVLALCDDFDRLLRVAPEQPS